MTEQLDIDINALKALVGDDTARHCMLLQKYVQSAVGAIQVIKAAYQDRDAEPIRQQAHKLKSSSRSIGAGKLASLFQGLESSGGEARWHEIDILLPQIDTLYSKVEAYIENYCSRNA